MSNYGLSSERAAAKYEAWLREKPTKYLWELVNLLVEPDLPADEADFVAQLIAERADPDAALREWSGQ